MLGLVNWGEGRKVTAARERLLGMWVLRVCVPAGGRGERRRVKQAARLLSRQGVRRLLPLKEFGYWDILRAEHLRPVDPLPLYRTMADQLVLELLSRRKVPPGSAQVALCGEDADGDLTRAAWLLCPRVRTLTVQVDRGGERLAQELYRQFGAAVTVGGRADAAVRFGGVPQEGELVLCGTPDLLGLEPEVPGLTVPPELEPACVLTALWQSGCLGREELRVRSNKSP